MKKGRIFLVLLLMAVIAGSLVAYRMWNKPHDRVENIEGMEVTVAELTGAYAADEAQANSKYLNRAIVVKGTVTEVEDNQDGKLLVILEDGVQCTMRENGAMAKVGSVITIKGFCTGSSLFGVLLSDCVIVK